MPQPALGLVTGATMLVESTAEVLARLAPPALGRVRLLGTEPELAALEPAVTSTPARPVLLGRVELLRCLREQAVSRTLHRYGNVVLPFDDPGTRAGSGRRGRVDVGGRPSRGVTATTARLAAVDRDG